MKLKNILALLLAALMLLAATGCVKQPASEPAPAEEPVDEEPVAEGASITATDMMGREVTLIAPAKRVVAITAADCEILFAVGAGDTLMGRGEYCDYPAEVLNAPSVQSGYETNVEQIIALAPDLVVTSAMDQSKEQIDQLEAAGIAVAVSDADDIEGVCESIKLIGALTGHDEEAASLIYDMQIVFVDLDCVTAPEGSTVYFEVSPLEYGLWTAGSGTFMDEIAKLLGLENCFADVEGWVAISEEQVLERDPDYIVTVSMYYGEGPTPVEEIMDRPGWSNVTAVRNGDILNLQNNELTRPGPRLMEGALLMRDFVADSIAVDPAA